MTAPFVRDVQRAVSAGVSLILDLQDEDGFWREYNLEPGASEAWSTAWVGWCLAGTEMNKVTRDTCARAATALAGCRTEGGWGYNHKTGPDADTTAWVLRFLACCMFRQDPVRWLRAYVDPGGGVHTFCEPGLGSWTDPHDDVAANVGLALLASPTSGPLAAQIRQRLISRFPWQTFWWSTPTYGIAWVLRFLTASGGLPRQVRENARAWLASLPATTCCFENAHRLTIWMQLENVERIELELVNEILDAQAGHGGWPPSTGLLVPAHEAGGRTSPNSEIRGALTTSICVRVLSEWLTGIEERT